MNTFRLYTTVFAVALLLPLAAFAGDKGLEIGDQMPLADVKMKNVDGEMISLSDVQGDKGTLVVFTCNHCPYVKAWEERTVELMNNAKQMGYGVVAINSNDPSEYDGDSFQGNVERASAAGMKYPYVVDDGSKLAARFGATRTPEFFLFGADDKLVYHGALDDNAQNASAVSETYLADAMVAQTQGNAIDPATTKSVGCSIKWYK